MMKRKLFLSLTLALLSFGMIGFSGCAFEDGVSLSFAIANVVYENMYKESVESIRKYNEEHDTDYLCYPGETTETLACFYPVSSPAPSVFREEFTFQNTTCAWYVIPDSINLDITNEWTYQETISACFPNRGESDIFYMTDENGYCIYKYQFIFESYHEKRWTDYYLTTDTTDRAIPLAALSYIL